MSNKAIRVGSYFGEIAMIYGCRRTCTIISRKYSTLAVLTFAKYREISTEFPDLSSQLKEGIYKYKDGLKKFMLEGL